MQAAWYAKNGPARDVLETGQRPRPEPGSGEVRVKIAFSGVNPSDTKSRAGSRPVAPGAIVVPHSDGAGVIDAVGHGVPETRLGERVWIWNGQYGRAMGTAAQYICLPAAQAVPLPEKTSLEAGACLGIPALTAIHAVDRLGDIAGKTVLVVGAASSVGFYAAQMARLRGATVIGTVGSQEKSELLARQGIAETIDYKRESVPDRLAALTNGRGVDGVIDMDFSTTSRLVPAGAVAPHATFVCYGSNHRGDVPLTFSAWLPRSISLVFFLVYELPPAERERAISELNQMLEREALAHLIAAAYPLARIAAAHEAVENGRTLGNIVVALPE